MSNLRSKYSFLILFLGFFPGISLLGQSVLVQRISIIGNKKTKPRVLAREMTFAVGDSLKLEDWEDISTLNHNNIYNLGLFNKVEFIDSVSEDHLFLTIHIQERWYVFPLLNFGFEERNFNEWWKDRDLDRVVYGAGIDWQNFTGRNDRLEIYGQNGYSRRARVVFRKPYLFPKFRINGQIGFQWINYKEVGYGTQNGIMQWGRLTSGRMKNHYEGWIELEKLFTQRKKIEFGVEFDYFQAADSIVFFNENYLTNPNNIEYYPTLYGVYINDQRDLKSFPMDGHKVQMEARLSGLPGISTTQFLTLQASYTHHIPIRKRWNFSFGTDNMYILGKRVPYYDKLFIGFQNVIRGYEPYVIDGNFFNMTKVEMKFAILPRRIFTIKKIPFKKFRDFPLGLYLSAYGDAGIVLDNTFNNHDNTFKNTLLLGYGAGVNVITFYDLLFRFEYSFNRLGQHGFYIHSSVSIR